MECVRYEDADSFCRRVDPFLTAREIENNLILGISGGLRYGRASGAEMFAVEDGGRVRLAAVMTPPFRIIVSKGEPDALPYLIDGIRRDGIGVPGVVGPLDMSQAFADQWHATTGERIAPATGMTLYTLSDVVTTARAEGRFRQADEADLDTVVDWMVRFGEELSLPSTHFGTEVAKEKIGRQAIFFWERHGAAVSMAGYNEVTAKGVRVSLVYTPPAERRKGYAAACVSHLSRHLLDSGRSWCVIFADMDNPTSNSIYRRMGYRKAATYREFDFAPADAE